MHEFGYLLGEAAALDQLHAEVRLSLVLAYLVDGQDVGVIEVGGRLRLRAKALDIGIRCQGATQDHLQRDNAVERNLAGAVDDAHPAAGNLLEKGVVANVAHGHSRCWLRGSGRERGVIDGNGTCHMSLVAEKEL